MLKICLILIGLICSVCYGKPKFSVGAIFKDKDDGHEIVFQSAIDRINIYYDYELSSIIQYGNIDDSFVLEKMACNLISQGVIAIFGPSSETDIISSICNTLEIPFIAYDWSTENTANENEFHTMTINLYPDNLVLTKAYADIIKDFTWRSYTIIYETRKELSQIQDILQIHGPKDNPITVRKLPEDTDYRPFLKKIKTSGESCIILHCSINKIVPILRQANELKMLGEYQSFFLAPLDTHTIDLEELSRIESNVTSIRITDLTSFDLKNAVYDWQQSEKRLRKQIMTTIHNAKTTMFTLHDALWIFSKSLTELKIIDDLEPPKLECKRNKPWPFGRRITEFIKAKTYNLSTGRIDFNENGQRIYFQARIIQLSPSGFQDIAKWNPINGVGELNDGSDSSLKLLEERIQNKTFIVTSRIGAPFLMHKPQPNDDIVLEGNDRYEGYSMDLIKHIASILKFNFRFELAPDGRYGSYNPVTKKWDGLIKQILDGKADLGICDLTMTSARRKAVDFTPPFMTLGISILYSKPEIPPTDLFSFLSPFSLDVWIYMGTALLGVSLLLYALARMAPDDWENPHPCSSEPDELENLWTIPNTTWLVTGSIMGQGCDMLPKAASTRLATGMWWFFALMMLNSYTANLAAFLTMSRMDAPIESAEDLAKQSKIKYGAVSGGSTQAFFRDSNFSIYQRMWAAMESARPSVFTKSNDEGVERVQKSKGLYAFLMESTTLEYIIERKCEVQQIGGWLDSKTYGIAMPFNSPYRKQISETILKLGESGKLAEIKRKWWKEKYGGGKCSQVSEASVDTPELDIKNVGGVFLVLGCGLLSAIIIGIGEFLWNIRRLSVEEKITPLEAIKSELMFFIKFWLTTKPVRTSTHATDESATGTGTSKRSSKSIETKSINTIMNLNHHNNIDRKRNSTEISMRSLKSNKSFDNNQKNRNNLNV